MKEISTIKKGAFILGWILWIAIGIYYIFQLEFIMTCESGTDICYNWFGHQIYIWHWFSGLSKMNFLWWGKQILFYTIIPLMYIFPLSYFGFFKD